MPQGHWKATLLWYAYRFFDSPVSWALQLSASPLSLSPGDAGYRLEPARHSANTIASTYHRIDLLARARFGSARANMGHTLGHIF